MKVAIDKDVINKIENLKEFDYIYLFDNEPLEYLLNLKLHCIHKDFISEIDDVDINLTKYKMGCIKQTTIEDKDWRKLPPKKNYKFAIIVPNYNNDHRRL